MAMVRVGVIGAGAIGSVLISELLSTETSDVLLDCVVTTDGRDLEIGSTIVDGVTIEEAIRRSDLLVECAGQSAVRQYGPRILRSGTDLLISSVGPLADPKFRRIVAESGPGTLHITSGAIGGLDLLRALRQAGDIHQVSLVTTKSSQSLVQPWMSETQTENLITSEEEVTLFRGAVAEVVEKFPQSMNIAASVALALGDWELPRVTLIGSPQALFTQHEMYVKADAGRYQFTFTNSPSPKNPRSSAVVPFALLSSLKTLVRSYRNSSGSGLD